MTDVPPEARIGRVDDPAYAKSEVSRRRRDATAPFSPIERGLFVFSLVVVLLVAGRMIWSWVT